MGPKEDTFMNRKQRPQIATLAKMYLPYWRVCFHVNVPRKLDNRTGGVQKYLFTWEFARICLPAYDAKLESSQSNHSAIVVVTQPDLHCNG